MLKPERKEDMREREHVMKCRETNRGEGDI